MTCTASWSRGLPALFSYGAGILAGAVIVPALLPWIPGRAFSFKGIIAGLVLGGLACWSFRNEIQGLEILAMVLLATAVSSYLAMNFTGSTPYTSPSGVEKEMRRAIPVQALSILVAAVSWVVSGFKG